MGFHTERAGLKCATLTSALGQTAMAESVSPFPGTKWQNSTSHPMSRIFSPSLPLHRAKLASCASKEVRARPTQPFPPGTRLTTHAQVLCSFLSDAPMWPFCACKSASHRVDKPRLSTRVRVSGSDNRRLTSPLPQVPGL